ncbi:hypothetical protein D3C76_1570100 [compost metagenome]
MRRRLEAAGNDFGGVGAGIDAERQAGAEGGTGQQRPEDTLAHRFELGQAVVDQEQLHQHRRATNHVGIEPGTEIDQRLLGYPHQPQRDRRQQTEYQ